MNLIHSDQTGFLKNRFIGENIRKTLDLIEYTEQEDIPALLISIDFEKCFDRVEWQAVTGALRYFNFGEKFIKWINLLYQNIESCTTNNGFSSNWFKPSRGLRQGCPLSPYLFLVTAELLGNSIRKNKNIKGIKLNDNEYKLTQYADDTNLFTLYNTDSLNSIIHTFSEIQKQTGLKINYDKTSIYRIGSIRHSNAKLYTLKPFKWETDPINLLGIIFIKDIVDPRTNEFLSFEAFAAKYGHTVTFVEYHGLISAIPRSMKQILHQIPHEDKLFVHNYEKFINNNWDSKYFYSKFIENPHIVPTLSVKWKNLLQTAIDDETISKVLENIKVITLSTKLRSFLYRFIHFAIPTNTRLYEWKIVDSELCTFCNTEPETYIHLFWECQVAKQIWNQIELWCKNKANRNITPTLKKIMLCKLSLNVLDCINSICLITMQYIYGSRCLRKLPNFAQLK